jgi:hypothetical protein
MAHATNRTQSQDVAEEKYNEPAVSSQSTIR